MGKKFPKMNIKFHSNVITNNQTNKDYHSYHDSHSVYQTYPNILICILRRERIKNDLANHVPLD